MKKFSMNRNLRMASIAEMIKRVLKYWKLYTSILTPFLSALIFLVSTSKETRCSYVLLIMVIYWMTEAIPIGITALIPVFAFPLMGVLSSSVVCSAYVKETLFLFIGGLIVAISVEHCNLHKRIALFVILHVGQSPRKLMAGFMLTTMFLSMWISNTASTAMMVPIVDAVLKELYKTVEMKNLGELNENNERGKLDAEEEVLNSSNYSVKKLASEYKENICNTEEMKILYIEINKDKELANSEEMEGKGRESIDFRTLKNMYFLGIAYSANIGGTGSLTGTTPNLVLKGFLDTTFDSPTGLNFSTWMAFNVPGTILCTVCGFLWLQFMFLGFGSRSKLPEQTEEQAEKVKQFIKDQYKKLGRITFHEKTVLTIFIVLVFLWLFRDPGFMVGWQGLIQMCFPTITLGDGVPAILATVLLFIIPSRRNFWPSKINEDKPSPSCITWKIVHEKLPWDVVLLIGGGFAMAKACNDSGLSVFLGEKLRFFGNLSPPLGVLIISMSTALATEVVSNVATASITMPILQELALKMCVNPLYLMLPAAVCCSYAFMLPVATTPNIIVYGVSGMKTSVMMKAGIVMNILCVLIINIMINSFGILIFNVRELPLWVNSTSTLDHIQDCFQNSSI